MFYSLTGEVVLTKPGMAVISCSGVAFKCLTSLNTIKNLPLPGEKATLYTHMAVHDDSIDLFGFSDSEELELFRLLITVSGVGPKASVAILSCLDPSSLTMCIATGDAKSITAAQGVGLKTAQRIVLELKDKIGKISIADGDRFTEAAGVVSASANASDAVEALVALGYPRSEASLAVGRLDSSLPAGDLIKLVLKQFGSKL